jgi:predicted RNase H-like HicB family nuclease
VRATKQKRSLPLPLSEVNMQSVAAHTFTLLPPQRYGEQRPQYGAFKMSVIKFNSVKNRRKFTVVIERDEEGYFVGTVPTLRGCHTQAKTLDTLMKRMREAVEVCLESEDGASRSLELVGVQQISI